jgi:hypothetical protein
MRTTHDLSDQRRRMDEWEDRSDKNNVIAMICSDLYKLQLLKEKNRQTVFRCASETAGN